MWILALIPGALVFAFNAIKPGYFEPLFASLTGWIIVGLAVTLWSGSLLLAWRVLAVQL
jgi:Flp pilus assembly protein TadB